MLERPLVIGFLWGLVTGDVAMAIPVAVFFELFWLDAIPVGSYVPPNVSATTLSCLTLIQGFGLSAPGQMLLPIFLCAPLAFVGARLEAFKRELENRGYNQLLLWARHPSASDLPARLVHRSLLLSLALSFAFMLASLSGLWIVLGFFMRFLGPWLAGLRLDWTPLWIAAGLGGVLSLRFKRAQAVLALGALGVMFFAALALR